MAGLFLRRPLGDTETLAKRYCAKQIAWRRWNSASSRPRGHQRRILTTLDPSKLTQQDFIDISGLHHPCINSRTGVNGAIGRTQNRYPEDAKGFLYYHGPPPNFPPVMGELRLRITESSDPSSFNNGTDMLDPKTTMPWNIPLLLLMKKQTNRVFRELLVTDGLISADLVQYCDMLWQDSARFGYARNITLYYLEQPFFVRFNLSEFYLCVVLKDRLAVCRIMTGDGIFKGYHSGAVGLKGSGIVRFERSKGSDSHLAIRVMKIVEPIKNEPGITSSRICEPVEGKLLQRITPSGISTLLINLDLPRARGLKELYQATRT